MADNPYEPERREDDDPAREPASPDAAPEQQTTDPSGYPSTEPAPVEPAPAEPAAEEPLADEEPVVDEEPLADESASAGRPVTIDEPVSAPAADHPTAQYPTAPAATDYSTAPAPAAEYSTATAATTPDSATSPGAATSEWLSSGSTPTTQVAGPGAVSSTFDVRDRPSGAHEAERPVPRSGLAEHYSAGYLTGELSPREDVSTPTSSSAPPAAPEDASEQTAVVESTAPPTTEREDPVLAGATAVGKPPSRAKAHVWGVILTLLLTPVAWYLLADAGARLTLPAGNPWDTANLNIAALLELAGGLLVLIAVLLAARWSSVGAIVTGSLVLVVGVPFVAVPAWTQDLLGPVTDWLSTLGDFGDNVAHHLVATGSTGRFVVYGVALIFIGVVSHGARRKGRRDVRAPQPAVD